MVALAIGVVALSPRVTAQDVLPVEPVTEVVLALPAKGELAVEPASVDPASTEAALGTAITYQGVLRNGNAPANGSFDFQFQLFNAASGGTQRGPTLVADNVSVSQGRFNTILNFGNIFGNEALWLAVGVRTGTSTGAFTALNPRQAVTPAPQARYAANAGSLALPWNATISSADALLDLKNSGTGVAFSASSLQGGTAANFESTGDSFDSTIRVYNLGSGGSIAAISNGESSTIQAQNNGTGGVAHLKANNAGSVVPALYVGSVGGNAIEARTESTSGASTTLNVMQSSTTVGAFAAKFLGAVEFNGTTIHNGLAYFPHSASFVGPATFTGPISKPGGTFKIDHPLDPANKFLQHSFVESPDMMNVYNGNVLLDENGEAEVTLPDYFEALNRDFRYQLTAIGGAAPNLHIAGKIANNRFSIAGGPPHGEVSWQVTGIRHDRWAEENRIEVEVEKDGGERGHYLYPQGFGFGDDWAIYPINDSAPATSAEE